MRMKSSASMAEIRRGALGFMKAGTDAWYLEDKVVQEGSQLRLEEPFISRCSSDNPGTRLQESSVRHSNDLMPCPPICTELRIEQRRGPQGRWERQTKGIFEMSGLSNGEGVPNSSVSVLSVLANMRVIDAQIHHPSPHILGH